MTWYQARLLAGLAVDVFVRFPALVAAGWLRRLKKGR